MLFSHRSKLTVLIMVLISILVGLAIGRYSTTWGAASIIIMYVSLAITAHSIGKVKYN
ncbi:hypothetical protein VSF3289_03293 [Vibrio scophthalmi]|uniref:Uncharacterized protein n=1 Tax=Vibrio scophthalmi TaxID=45658 RepID=A0A1E3WIW0_9VIBR|nr:hypothetical protein VSF3289_03293 [Vibrio scophthalmi]